MGTEDKIAFNDVRPSALLSCRSSVVHQQRSGACLARYYIDDDDSLESAMRGLALQWALLASENLWSSE